MARIAWMPEDFLVFLAPMVDFVSLERDEIFYPACRRRRVAIAPRRVVDAVAGDFERAMRRLAERRGLAAVIAGLENIGAHMLGREIIDRQVSGPRDHDRVQGLRDRLAIGDRADTLGTRLEAKPMRVAAG